MVFSKEWSSECANVKKFFKDKGITFGKIEMDVHKDGAAIHEALKSLSGQTTVPVVYINGRYIGGEEDAIN